MSAPEIAALHRTALFDFHRAHGAHLVPFAGWEMPLYYTSILAEHDAVRRSAGLFDVGHMGILTVDGPSAAALLSRRTCANAERIAPGQARYAFFLEATGRIVDDLLITRLDRGETPIRSFLAVPNAARATEIANLLRQHRHPDTTVQSWNDRLTILAVQGPDSRRILEGIGGWSLAPLKFYTSRFYPDPARGRSSTPSEGRVGGAVPGDLDRELLVSRTGYTGELGYELFLPRARAAALAEELVRAGVRPCGLGARDTLRLEKGYLLSGQDFHRDRTPIEAGQERFVELDHPFVGREALAAEIRDGPKERLAGISVAAPGAVPRHGTPILHAGAPVGVVSSGGLSPTLKVGIALAYLPRPLAEPGTAVALELRGGAVPAQVVPLPFVPATRARP